MQPPFMFSDNPFQKNILHCSKNFYFMVIFTLPWNYSNDQEIDGISSHFKEHLGPVVLIRVSLPIMMLLSDLKIT